MTPIYDALRATALPSTPAHVADAVSNLPAEGRPDLRLVPPGAPAPVVPTPFPVRVLSTRRTPPWRAGLQP